MLSLDLLCCLVFIFALNGLDALSIGPLKYLAMSHPRANFLMCKEGEIENDVSKKLSISSSLNIDLIRKRNVRDAETPNFKSFGIFNSTAKFLYDRTGGWGLGYADTTPYNVNSINGLVFLSTNFLYYWAGLKLWINVKDYLFSIIIIFAGVMSMYYHWSQLHYGPNRDEVRIALLIDYFAATIAILFSTFKMGIFFLKLFSLHTAISISWNFVIFGVLGVGCLLGSWVLEYGLPYLILHGLWHVFSAAAVTGLGTQLNILLK